MSDSAPPCIVILAAPSGSGKTSMADRLLAAVPSMSFSVSATTRPRRKHEVDGVHYHFLSQTEFDRRLRDGQLLEAEEVYPGCWYGTLESEVLRSDRTRPVLLDVDVEGALRVKEAFGPAALAVFVQPPSLEILEQRLRARGTESEASLRTRIDKARLELTYAPSFDHVVVNDDLDRAAGELLKLVQAFMERC